ncbi:hypothetical protein [Aurantivibrio plasticivorans]
MYKRLTFLSLLSILGACTSVKHIPLTEEQSQNLTNKTIVQSSYSKPDFTAMTAGKAAFAAFGAIAMIAEGNSIVEENDIEDPARYISNSLAEALVDQRGMKLVSSDFVSESDKVSDLVDNHPKADYILDYKTFGWMFGYYPADWSHYRVGYSGRLRVVDAAEKKVIAETLCSAGEGDDENPPTKDDLLENNAQLLKDYLQKAADNCVAVLASDILLLK